METNKETRVVKETPLSRQRVKAGMTQNDLSKASGVSLRLIKGYEQQERNIDGAKLETLCKLAIALNCGIDKLVENDDLKKLYKKASCLQ